MSLTRDKLFTLMLVVTVLLTLVFGGLVLADLQNAHKTVTTALTGGTQSGDGGGAAAGGATPTAAPGAQGSSVVHSSQQPGAAGNTNPGVKGSAGGVPNMGVQGGVIRIGSIITQTGPGRSITMAHALTAWAKWTDSHGGINGYKISLDLRDDGGNADTGAADYHDFAAGSNAVFAMVAECAPPTDEQMAGFINQNHMIMVGECQAPPDMYTSPYMWLTGPNPYENGELGAKLMVALQHWPLSGGKVALVCLNDPSTQKVCDGAAHLYGSGNLWQGGPQEEAITDNNYQQLITEWCSQNVTSVHLVLEPGSTQRYLYAAQNQTCSNGKPWNPPTFQNLVIDDGVAHYGNAAGMMIGTPWTPLDQTGTPGMQRLTQTLQTYYPDDKVDLYAQTSWSYCLLFEHAVQMMGGNVTKQNLIDTLNAIHNWDTGLGAVENYSPTQHDGDVKNWLMQLKNPGDNWQLAGAGGPVRLS